MMRTDLSQPQRRCKGDNFIVERKGTAKLKLAFVIWFHG